MFGHERSLVQRFAGQPFVLLGVSADETPEKLHKLEQKANLTWPSVFDGPRGPIARTWDVHVFPTLVLIDAAGVVRYRREGAPPEGLLEAKIEELLRDAMKEKLKS